MTVLKDKPDQVGPPLDGLPPCWPRVKSTLLRTGHVAASSLASFCSPSQKQLPPPPCSMEHPSNSESEKRKESRVQSSSLNKAKEKGGQAARPGELQLQGAMRSRLRKARPEAQKLETELAFSVLPAAKGRKTLRRHHQLLRSPFHIEWLGFPGFATRRHWHNPLKL